MKKKYPFLLSWSFYDFSNSAYVLIINSFFFPIFFKKIICENNSNSDFYWGLCVSISVILSILFGPLIGFVSDKKNRKNIFNISIVIIFIGLLALSFFNINLKLLYALFFILTNMFFIFSLILYDSFLPHITSKQDVSLYSAFGWGFGYIGGVACFLIILLIQKNFGQFSQINILATGIFFIIFSLPPILFLPKTKSNENIQLKETFKKFLDFKLIKLLLSFWIINDVIAVLIYFTAIYAETTLKLDMKTIGMLLLATQILAFPFTWFLGILAKRKGEVKIILISLFVWAFIILGLIFSKNLIHLIFVSFLTSLVIGTTQSILRSYYSSIIPKNIAGSSFGIFSIMSKSSALVGPLLFGAISSFTGSQKIGLLSMLFILIIGGILFYYQAKYFNKETQPFV